MTDQSQTISNLQSKIAKQRDQISQQNKTIDRLRREKAALLADLKLARGEMA